MMINRSNLYSLFQGSIFFCMQNQDLFFKFTTDFLTPVSTLSHFLFFIFFYFADHTGKIKQKVSNMSPKRTDVSGMTEHSIYILLHTQPVLTLNLWHTAACSVALHLWQCRYHSRVTSGSILLVQRYKDQEISLKYKTKLPIWWFEWKHVDILQHMWRLCAAIFFLDASHTLFFILERFGIPNTGILNVSLLVLNDNTSHAYSVLWSGHQCLRKTGI